MTQERNQPGQGGSHPGGSYPSSTQVPGTTHPEPLREPWDPRREPQGAPMPWENDKDKDKDMKQKGQDQRQQKR